MSTKAEMEQEIVGLKAQVADLQNEVGDRSMQLGDAEAQAQTLVKTAESLRGEMDSLAANLLDGYIASARLQDASIIAEGLAAQLAWTLATVQSISLYQPDGETPAQKVAAMIMGESQPFWTEWRAGTYSVESLTGQLEDEANLPITNENEEGAFNLDETLFSLNDVAEFIRVNATDQEIPDDQPDSLNVGDDSCLICGDEDCTS